MRQAACGPAEGRGPAGSPLPGPQEGLGWTPGPGVQFSPGSAPPRPVARVRWDNLGDTSYTVTVSGARRAAVAPDGVAAESASWSRR